MTQLSMETFKGLETQGDSYSVEGSPDCQNVEIDIYNDINKAMGYTTLTMSTLAFTRIKFSGGDVTVYCDNSGVATGNIVIFHGLTNPNLTFLNGYAYRIKLKVSTDRITIDKSRMGTADVTEAGTMNLCLKSVVHAVTPIAPTGGVLISALTCLGYSEFNGDIIRMLSNGTNGYLVKTTGVNSADLTIVEDTLLFDAAALVRFCQFSDPRSDAKYLVFVNGVKKTIGGNTGGTFYWAGTAGSNVINLFGIANNPTGKYIESHDSRLWVGYITAQANTDITNGKHWIAVSKLFPEATDTSFSISAMTITPAVGGRTYITATGHTFKVGDEIYIDGVVGSAGTSVLNGAYHTISEVATNTFYIDADTYGFTYTSGGTATLRGNTWSPSTAIYENVLTGAGIMRPDNEITDYIVGLKSAFGVLTIYRTRSVFFFTGSIESNDVALARRMNIPFGCVSPSLELTDGGVWFCGAHGLYKTHGITIDTVRTELDTIQASPFTEVIKPTYDAISNKAGIVLFLNGNTLYMHDKDNSITYTLNLINSQWGKLTSRNFDGFVRVGNTGYGVKSFFTFLLDSGYQTYNITSFAAENIASYYKTDIFNFGDSFNFKHITSFIALIKSATSTAQNVYITFNLRYNGSSSVGGSFSFDIKTTSGGTWDAISSNATLTWNQVTNTGTYTWNTITGNLESMVKKLATDLGVFHDLQIEITHTGNEAFKISRFSMEYDLIAA